MKRGYGVGEKYAADPIGSNESRGKNRERRKHKLDGPTLTPTESHIKNNLMRQFMRNPEGSADRDDSAYKSSSAWCRGCDGKRLAVSNGYCDQCLDMATAVGNDLWDNRNPPVGRHLCSETVFGSDSTSGRYSESVTIEDGSDLEWHLEPDEIGH